MNAPSQLDPRQLDKIAKRIHASASRSRTLMELCGGQTASFLEYNFAAILPEHVRLVHGPGCAICAAPVTVIDKAVAIARADSVIFCAPGELLRLKGSQCDLLEVKAAGHDVRVVHSPLDCLNIARESPDKRVVFLSIGFEMSIQLNALSVWQAKRLGLRNYSLLSFHGYFPSLCNTLLKEPGTQVEGIIGLGAVCNVTGFAEYEILAKRFKKPFVVTGYEPINLLEGIEACIDMIEHGKYTVENLFREGAKRNGNREARALINEVFTLADQEWRGVGLVEGGGYRLKPEFAAHDAEQVFDVEVETKGDSSACISKLIQFGFKKPTDCPLFAKSCRPGSALGATMVSNEGTCATYFNYLHKHHI